MSKVSAFIFVGIGYMAKSIIVTISQTSENLFLNLSIMIGLIVCLILNYADNKK